MQARTPPSRRPALHAGATAAARRDRLDAGPGVLAPVQFLIFLISLVLVAALPARPARATSAATVSVVIKTLALYAIMVTGCIWEKAVFGRYLFAPAFFWEDVFSMLVLALHTAYLVALATGSLGAARADAAGARRLRDLRRSTPRSSC